MTLSTAYEGVYLETYNIELDVRPTLKISRHNVPPFIPLGELCEPAGRQKDLRGFLDPLMTRLNAFAGRRQQLRLVKVTFSFFFFPLVPQNHAPWICFSPTDPATLHSTIRDNLEFPQN